MDVALIQWPSQRSLRARLAEQGHPRLLLVESDGEPPMCVDVLEDWVRLPVPKADRNARIEVLQERAGRLELARPVLSHDGTLDYRGATAQLSELQVRVIDPLIDRFGAVVSRDVLGAHAWPGADAIGNNLDVTMRRLRRQVEQVGLMVRTVRSRGYLLAAGEPG